MKHLKFTFVFTLLLLLLFSLCACGGKTLSLPLRSVELSTYGEPLNGNSRVPDATIIVKENLHDGDDVTLDYSGHRYHGTIGSRYVIWDEDPNLLDGGTLMYTTISIRDQVVTLEFSFSYGVSSGDASIDMVQTFYE